MTAGPVTFSLVALPLVLALCPSASLGQSTPAAVNYDNVPIHRADAPVSATSAATPVEIAPSLDLPRLITAFAVVLGLIFLLRWGAKHWFAPQLGLGTTRAVQVLARSPIAARQSVVLMRVGRRLLVVADNGSQMNSLAEITDPDEVATLVGQIQNEKTDLAAKTFGLFMNRFKKEEDLEMPAEPSADLPTPAAQSENDEAPTVLAARAQLNGLMEQVRLVSGQFRQT